jgi:hypothetical protein
MCVIPLLLLLAGCAGDYTADKSGVTDQQKAIDVWRFDGRHRQRRKTNPTRDVMRNLLALAGASLILPVVLVTSAAAQGYVIQSPGQSPTFVGRRTDNTWRLTGALGVGAFGGVCSN